MVLVGWVFFRAETVADGWRYLSAMVGAGAGADAARLLPKLLYEPLPLKIITLYTLLI